MKKVLCGLLCAVLLVTLSVPAMAGDRDWEGRYTVAIAQNTDSWGNIIQLVDLDVDGTPELLIGSYPGSGLFSEILAAYTFQDGELKPITLPGSVLLGGNYALYRNNTTGAYRIEGDYILRAGNGFYTNILAHYGLNGTRLTIAERFADDVEAGVHTYYVGGRKVSASVYKNEFTNRNAGWSKVGTYHYAQLTKRGKPTSGESSKLISDYAPGPVLAKASTHKIQVDGKPVSIAAYGIGGNNYFKLRDVAALLNGTDAQFQVGWKEADRSITLTDGQRYTPVGGELARGDGLNRFGNPTSSDIYLNGQLMDPAAYNVGGNNYFKLRDLGRILGFNVVWNDATRTVDILTDQPYSE